jgi:RNA polymerase sigma-70 factor (ECF subfamily)
MAAEALSDLSDRQLVEQLLAGQTEAVFEAVVRRHGAMVYRVCSRVLQHHQDAEDCFQATFLVLAQKLRALRKHASLASWLHGVAYRVALKAKAEAAARRCHEAKASVCQTMPPDDLSWGEVRAVLDAELARLPEKWRLPLVLCYLEARTQDEAAAQLGWSKRTLRRRLEEGRTGLGRRLSRRGVIWSAAVSAVLVSESVASAALSLGLVDSTVQAASLFAAGQTAAKDLISVKAAVLTKRVLESMCLAKLKIAMVVVGAAALLASGFSAVAIPAQQARPTDGNAFLRLDDDEAPHQPPARTDKEPSQDKERLDLSRTQNQPQVKTDKEMLQGTWRLLETHKHGKKVDAKDIPINPHRLLIDGSKVEIKLAKGGGDCGEFELNTAATPKEITITWLIQWRGIYRLDQDKLTICFNPDNGIRPDEFRTAADSGRVLFIYERTKKKEDKEPPEEAEKDRERPKKFARMIAPSAELRRDLSAFDAYRHGSEEKFLELERKADELLKKYTAPDDQARIYFEVAHVAAQSDIRNHVKRVRRFAERSLALSRDPLQRGCLYSYLGSAAEVEVEKTFEDRRQGAAAQLLMGYAEMLAQELPAKVPELPRVDKLGAEGIDPDPVKAAQARARYAAQMTARREAEFIRDLVHRRDTLANQLRGLYHPDPRIHGRDPDGPEKLRALAGKVLNDPTAVEALLELVIEP